MTLNPFKKTWYSVCSAHRDFNSDCPRCKIGHWRNDWAHAVEHVIFKVAPGLWQWWVNRKPLRFEER